MESFALRGVRHPKDIFNALTEVYGYGLFEKSSSKSCVVTKRGGDMKFLFWVSSEDILSNNKVI